MLKIIVALDGQHFSESTLNMAKWLNSNSEILLTGVFLNPIDYREIIGYSDMGVGSPLFPVTVAVDEKITQVAMKKFETFCNKHQLNYAMHKDTGLFALDELLMETRFADCLLLSSVLFYENIDKDQPNEYLRKILHQSECPIILVPEEYEEPKTIVIAYDGKAASVHALKQFAYLFPNCTKMGTTLFYLADDKDEFPQINLLQELVESHYQPFTIESVPQKPEIFQSWLDENHHYLLITGAYGRGELSLLFKKSFINSIIKAQRVPIFVAHQ
jgi:hypothetical protein